MENNTILYDKVIAISEDYLGPASERFINRQIMTHLQIEPKDLQINQLKDLVKWVRLTFAVLTNNTVQVDEFSSRLLKLSDNINSHPIAMDKVTSGDPR